MNLFAFHFVFYVIWRPFSGMPTSPLSTTPIANYADACSYIRYRLWNLFSSPLCSGRERAILQARFVG